ncbi:hypothetical protein G9P44_002138 [Scheffersomyces stipitis]|nr:hypothetical protein G9P44_002138 [Scheffersomyces stipitis]
MAMTASRLYSMYFHHFPFVMLTKTERMLLHTFLLSFTLFIGYGIYYYLPASIMFSLSRAYYYIFGLETSNPLSV